jgi:hypothetical protein
LPVDPVAAGRPAGSAARARAVQSVGRPVVVAPFMVVLFMAADVRVDDSGAGMAGPHLARLPVGRPSPGVRGAVRGSTR